MKKILLSFKPFWYEKIKSGEKIFEYRKRFCDEPVMAYMYVSRPVMAVTGIIMLDKRIELDAWAKEYRDEEEIFHRIADFRTRNKYAMPIKEFIPTTELALKDIQKSIPGFLAPQMYYVIEDGTDLGRMLDEKIIENGPKIVNNFNRDIKAEICKNIT